MVFATDLLCRNNLQRKANLKTERHPFSLSNHTNYMVEYDNQPPTVALGLAGDRSKYSFSILYAK